MIGIKHTGNYSIREYLPSGEPVYLENVEYLTEAFQISNLFDRPSTVDDFLDKLTIPLDENEVPEGIKRYIDDEVDAVFPPDEAKRIKCRGLTYSLAAFRDHLNDAFIDTYIVGASKVVSWEMMATIYLSKAEYQAVEARLFKMRKLFDSESMNRDYLHACTERTETIDYNGESREIKIPALTAEIEQKIINAVGTEIKVENSAKSIESILSHDPIVPDDVLSRINRLEYSDMLETLEGDLERYCMNLGVEEMAKINDISDPDAKEDIYYPLAEKYGFNEWYYYITLDEWKKRLLEVAAMKRGNA